ncbi:MAG: peptidase S41 [Anaerolineae bacterium]|jgi:C-terminal processing protease CtpA/Prc|nr:peptidase S41 [Anaerolineae bacterium]MBT7190758.1 peptidase S41 [Anaerolineae bacterium]MBT7988360.1 peptidase S41 [Anaerolineae bacterium]
MKIRSSLLLLLFALVITACQPDKPVEPTPLTVNAPSISSEEPYQITGTFDYTNDIITTYYVEHAVALVDMYAFITRDKEWEIPLSSQTLGFLEFDTEAMQGSYTLQLPAMPTGVLTDIDNDSEEDLGVQVFAIAYWPNLTGSPYSEGDDLSTGWPTYLASIITDTENEDEVISGDLVIWSPDNEQEFPSGFGADGKLFTADDPLAPVEAGYSVINIDAEPFTISRDSEPELSLYEPDDVAIKDFAEDSYTESFEKMFDIARKEYAFNGVEGKEPDWDALYAELMPRVEEAEKTQDASAFFLALRDFTWGFKDGHVGLNGGDVAQELFMEDISGGYGFAIRELDDGRVVVSYLLERGPADLAGISLGTEITQYNGKAIKDAISEVSPWSQPISTDYAFRFQQARYLLRAPLGTEAEISFIDANGTERTVSLAVIGEGKSFNNTSIYSESDPSTLPVEFHLLDSGAGYIKINSNYDDLNLIIRLFERGLKTFEELGVPGIIIDLRENSGGAPLGLAGFLHDEEIVMGQLEYYSDKTGDFEAEGLPDKVLPNENQYHFDKKVLLVGQACFSACEIEAYGFSQVPGMIVVGQYPTGGVEAEVARGQFEFPEGFALQIPTGRFKLPDGSIFLEGVGVQPQIRVPIDETTILSDEDVVLAAGEKAVSEPLSLGVMPESPPKIASLEESEARLAEDGAQQLEEKAKEVYSEIEMTQTDTPLTYTVTLSPDDDILWVWGWCAASEEILDDNLSKIDLEFMLEDESISPEQFVSFGYPYAEQSCQVYFASLSEWTAGEHHLKTTATWAETIDDGSIELPAGSQILEYTVYVNP